MKTEIQCEGMYFNIPLFKMEVNNDIPKGFYRQPWTYLHGELEDKYGHDIFYLDKEVTFNKGIHTILVNGELCNFYLWFKDHILTGLLVLVDDKEGNKYALKCYKNESDI